MKQNQNGFSLIELLVCILILGIIVRVALPTAVSRQGEKVELAAAEIAMALRFARDDAIRTASERGIRINRSTGQVTVYSPNLATTPATIAAILHNPLTKHPYDFNVTENTLTEGVRISNSENPFKFMNSADKHSDIFFNGHGMPLFINGAHRRHLESGSINLSTGSDTGSVVLSPFTGRVSIQ